MMEYNDYVIKFLNSLPNFLGYGKLLSQRDKDQGDCLQRVSEMFALLNLINDQELIQKVAKIHPVFDRTYMQLQPRTGWYVRSSNPKAGWQNDMRRTSRDQLAMAKVAFASCHDTHKLSNVLEAQMERGSFHQNYYNGTKNVIPDVITPNEISVFFRGLLGKTSQLFTWAFDMFFFIDLCTRTNTTLNAWSSDQILAVNLLFANQKYPSFVSKFIMKRYLATDFMTHIKAYHFDDPNGCQPLYYLYRAAYLKLENYNPENV